jgi:hypothetical protein
LGFAWWNGSGFLGFMPPRTTRLISIPKKRWFKEKKIQNFNLRAIKRKEISSQKKKKRNL